MEVHRETAQRSTGVKEVDQIVIELSPAEQYSMLTDANKSIVDRQIEMLVALQSDH